MTWWLRKPIVHLYAPCLNEERMLPFFFRHYEPWVQRFVIYDSGSTDRSLEILAARSDVEIRQFPWTDPNSFVLSHQAMQNTCWRESRDVADWVVVTDIDEFILHRRRSMPSYLRWCARRGITCVPALGYQMVTDAFPSPGTDLAKVHTRCVPSAMMSKLRLFDPRCVEPNFRIGSHTAAPAGRVVYPRRDNLLLLHYKDLGREYRAARNQLLGDALREVDRANRWGVHYRTDQAWLDQHFVDLDRQMIDLAAPGYVPWRDHRGRRFWRPGPRRGGAHHPRRPLWHQLWKRARALLHRGH